VGRDDNSNYGRKKIVNKLVFFSLGFYKRRNWMEG